MLKSVKTRFVLVSSVVLASWVNPAWSDSDVVNLGHKVPSVQEIQSGLFPDEACEQLKKNGFKCMGFKPAVRFSIPSENFKVGSAELPGGLKKQLDVFAQVLGKRAADSAPVLITGYADASGTDALNMALSEARARSVQSYLETKGVASTLLKTQGKGSQDLADAANPYAAKNRRVEIGRLPN